MPETIGIVDGNRCEIALECSLIYLTEGIETIGTGFKTRREDRLSKLTRNSIEERLLLLGLNGVDFAEGKANKTVGLSVLNKAIGYRRSKLNGLVGCCGTADIDSVCANNVTCSIGSISESNGE